MSKATHTTETCISPQGRLDVLSSSTSQAGVKTVGTDGKVFRLAQYGEDVLAGQTVQADIIDADFEGLAVVGGVAGTDKVTITLGAGAAAAGQFEGATLVVNSGTGAGLQFYVDTHAAADAAADLVLKLADFLPIALDATSVVSLIANPYVGVIVTPVAPTGKILGVAQNSASAGEWGLIQTRGYCPVIADGALAVADSVGAGSNVAGAVEAGVTPAIGTVVQTAIADTESGIVDLIIE